MKQIKIKSIKLSNWKSLNIKADFSGDKIAISGRNGIGKSSLYHAFNWVFSGWSESITPKNSNLFDTRVELTPDTPIASAEVVLTIDGYDYVVRREACAKFTRKRGSDVYEKAVSDEYKVFVDDIETSVSDFNSWIERNICPVNMLTYCLNGEFFTTLAEEDKDKARKVLENIIGEIRDEDFQGSYDSLFEMMERYNIEELTTQTKNKIKPINQRLEEIPAILENKQSELSEYKQINFADILKNIEEKKSQIEDIDKSILGSSEAIRPFIEKRNKELLVIEDKKHDLNAKLADYNIKQEELPNKLKRELQQLKEDNQKAAQFNTNQQGNIKRCKQSIIDLESDIERYSKYREQLIKQRDDVMALFFDANTCTYCGQELPYEKLEEAQAKFNENKQAKINNIVSEGRSNNKKIEDAKDKIKELEYVLDKESIPMQIKSTKELEDAIESAVSTILKYQNTAEYKAKMIEIDDLQSNLTTIPEQGNSNLTDLKSALMQDKEDLDRKYGLHSKVAEIEKEILNLESERRLLGTQLAKLEGLLFQIKEYQQEKANIVSNRVNDLLDYSMIEMERTQKDGSKISDCVICNKSGVKFATLNGASRILVRTDIQAMFNKYYGIALAIFVDDASIIDKSSLPQYKDHQMIYILNEDKGLTIENI